jgi:aryl-alcohol dehydrogenase-like predicted oxidoreductase
MSESKATGRQLARRPYGRAGVELSIVGMGGIVVVGMPQEAADGLVAEAVERGVNYFDVAPSYGDGEAEEKLGQALEPHRDRVFLACKTGKRDAEGARKELARSLERLRTDRLDLYQFHGVARMEDVERILAPGGAMEVFLAAREEGTVRHIGFPAHSVQAALAMMDRFRFDSVLFPINHVCYAQGNFGPQVVERARERGTARLAIKAMARTVKGDGSHKYPKCWYAPVDDPDLARQALRFTLSEDITACVPSGDERLFRQAVDLMMDFEPLAPAEREVLLAGTAGVQPIFSA